MFISHLFPPYYFNVSVPRLLLKTNFYIATLKTIALLIKSVDSIPFVVIDLTKTKSSILQNELRESGSMRTQ